MEAPRRMAARCLFGRPDSEEVSRHLNEGLAQIHAEDSRRWNFDFSGGVPLVGPDGDYNFEEIPAAAVPAFYHPKTIRARKTVKRRDSTPNSFTLEAPSALIASTSTAVEVYEKPVTRSSIAKQPSAQQEVETLKQTKLTNYMPVRKRRSETCLLASSSLDRSVSTDASNSGSQKEKRGIGKMNKGAPKRPLRFVSSNVPKSTVSVSDTALVSTPRSPPAKKIPLSGTSSRRGRRGAGDF